MLSISNKVYKFIFGDQTIIDVDYYEKINDIISINLSNCIGKNFLFGIQSFIFTFIKVAFPVQILDDQFLTISYYCHIP